MYVEKNSEFLEPVCVQYVVIVLCSAFVFLSFCTVYGRSIRVYIYEGIARVLLSWVTLSLSLGGSVSLGFENAGLYWGRYCKIVLLRSAEESLCNFGTIGTSNNILR